MNKEVARQSCRLTTHQDSHVIHNTCGIYLVEVEEGQSKVRGSVGDRELERDSQHEGQVLGTPVVPLDCRTQVGLTLLLLVFTHH